MKPKSNKVKFDTSWLALLPAHRRRDYMFMYTVAQKIKRRNIKRYDIARVRDVIKEVDTTA